MQLQKDQYGRYPNWTEKPYGVRVGFEVAGNHSEDIKEGQPSFIGIRGKACILLSEDHIFHFECDKPASKNKNANIWDVYIEGFETAAEAETAGECFAATLMLTSVMRMPSIRIRYTLPHPCEVYARKLPKKQKVRAFISFESTESSFRNHVESVDNLRRVWSRIGDISERLFLSLELYTSARFENSERARFIGTVSAIEPLAVQVDYGQEEDYDIEAIIKELCKEVDRHHEMPNSIRSSILGQIKNLRRESVRRACHRLIKTQLPGKDDALRTFDEAYNARSKMLHEGETPSDLHLIHYNVEQVIRRLLISFLPNREEQ